MTVFLETARLSLRRFTPGDMENLFALDSDPEVMRYLTGGAGTPREVIAATVLPKMLDAYHRYNGLGWFAAERPTGEFLGWFGIHPRDGAPAAELELGYRLRRECWGEGLATEGSRALLRAAFEQFGAARIVAQTYQDNLASRRVMEKLGMTFVRSFRVTSTEEIGGTYNAAAAELFEGDDVEYAITREVWITQR